MRVATHPGARALDPTRGIHSSSTLCDRALFEQSLINTSHVARHVTTAAWQGAPSASVGGGGGGGTNPQGGASHGTSLRGASKQYTAHAVAAVPVARCV